MSDTTMLPPPPVPANADLRHFPTMPLDVQRLRDSELAAHPDAEVRWAALLSWCAAWHQVPAGSLPDDDAALSYMLGYGRDLRRWRALRRKGALRGWYRARDGRNYHPTLTQFVVQSLAKSVRQRAAINSRWEKQAADNARLLGYDGNTGAETPVLPCEGKGIEGIRDTPSPSKNEGEGEGKSPDGDPPGRALVVSGKPAKVARPKKPEVPDDTLYEIAAVWNEYAAEFSLPTVRELSEGRMRALRARCRERWTTDPVRQFRAYVARIVTSPFLIGQEGGRDWRADFDWALRPASVLKVAEGHYHKGQVG